MAGIQSQPHLIFSTERCLHIHKLFAQLIKCCKCEAFFVCQGEANNLVRPDETNIEHLLQSFEINALCLFNHLTHML